VSGNNVIEKCFGTVNTMPTNADRRPRLSTTEVSRLFGVTRATLYRWIEGGKLPEPARDPENGWPVWQQPELDAIAKLVRSKKKKT
jgi:predicted DNA-binding transcriptional regulator AlpA